MIYDLLKSYKEFLVHSLAQTTAETYYKKLCILFEGQSISDTVRKLDIDMVLGKLGRVRHKSEFSKSKNAFLYFCEFQSIQLPAEALERIKELQKGTKKKHRSLKPIEYSEVDKKIKHIRDKRLKLSYQVIIATGLRVSELASISPNNCYVADDEITFSFIARGGANEVISITRASYPKLYPQVKILIEDIQKKQEKRLFYSVDYLQRKAKALGFGCHDLRRVFATLEYKKCRSKTEVMKKMRHKSLKATNIYLRSKVKI